MPQPVDPETATDVEVVADIESAPTVAATPGAIVETRQLGERIDRYVLLEQLGAGGMGVVYTAYDPDLDRKIALKFLHGDQLSTSGQARLLREAQAMAKLSHPNVATVFDVGTHEGRVFIAMELVKGPTLRRWLRTRRSWRELWPVFRQAAAGLGAAHEAGIVHRDFKPANVLLDVNGRAHVTDFGIALGMREDETDPAGAPAKAMSVELTETGVLIGTPGYMAPEQHMGGPVDARTDQFAFAIAVYEALYGHRPFAGANVPELAEATTSGAIRAAPAGADVPAWRRKILVRALSPDPADRYESMAALMAALDFDPAARTRRLLGGGATLVVFAGLVVFSATRFGVGSAACDVDPGLLGDTWSDTRKEAVRDAFAATGHPAALLTFDQVNDRLERRANEWLAARRDACVANRVESAQSDTLFDKRVACLERRLSATRALTDAFTEADATTIPRAIEAVEALPRIDDCGDVDLLSLAIPAPDDPAVRARLPEIEADLDRGRTRLVAGQIESGVAFAERALTAARAIDHPPVLGEALLLRAHYHNEAGDLDPAVALLEDATRVLAGSRHVRMETEAWTALAQIAMYRDDMQRARAMMLPARAAVARVGDEPGARAELLSKEAELLAADERYDDAVAMWQQLLELRRELHGPDSIQVAQTRYAMAGHEIQAGRAADAADALEEVAARFESLLGENNTRLANALCNLAVAYYHTDRYEDGVSAARRCYEIRKRIQAPTSPEIADAAHNLAALLRIQKKGAEASEILDEVLELRRQALGEDHPDVGATLMTIANVRRDAGDREAALALYAEAIAIFEEAGRAHGVAHGIAYRNVAITHYKAEDCGNAIEAALESVAVLEDVVGEDHPQVADSVLVAAACMRVVGRHAEAVAMAERSLTIRIARERGPDELADSGEILALALWDQGADRTRALEVAEQARVNFEAAGRTENAAELAAWIEEKRAVISGAASPSRRDGH